MQREKLRTPLKNRITPQRQLILGILKKDYSHPTADEIYDKVKKKMPRISLATVYRNLHFLVQINQAREIIVPGEASRYDGHLKDHDHFICNVCKRIYNVPKYPLQKKYLPNKNYKIGSFKLDLFGVCATCQGKAPCRSLFITKK